MNIKHTIWIVLGLLALVIVAAIAYVLLNPKISPLASPQPVTLPSSGSASFATSTPGGAGETMTVTAQDGTQVVVRDFINNGITIPDTANKGNYLLAGNLDYCPSDPQRCQAGPATDFNIYYDSANQSFGIALLSEPIGRVRVAMEQYLLGVLGITPAQLCALNYYVGTTRYVNEAYASKNLGFSFCPGATKLPQ